MKITITEALAEVKTIGKRVEKKKAFIAAYALRQDQVRDPLEKDGGSEKNIAQAFQSINDLLTRIIHIRSAIARANLDTSLTVGAQTRTVKEWLTWRKEVAPIVQQHLHQLRTNIEGTRQQMRQKGVTVGSVGVDLKPTDIVVNINEKQLADQAEQLEEVLGTLDGKLSLLNATVLIELPD